MFRNFVFAMFMTAFCLPSLMAECKASLFANDWNGELRSVNEVNDFCSKRAGWFRVDTNKYQPKDYCFSNKETRYDSYGRAYYVYPTLFWWPLKSFSGYYQDDVLGGIHNYMRDFSFKGWPSSVAIQFQPSC